MWKWPVVDYTVGCSYCWNECCDVMSVTRNTAVFAGSYNSSLIISRHVHTSKFCASLIHADTVSLSLISLYITQILLLLLLMLLIYVLSPPTAMWCYESIMPRHCHVNIICHRVTAYLCSSIFLLILIIHGFDASIILRRRSENTSK